MKHKDFFTVKINDEDSSLQVKDFSTLGKSLALTAGQFLHVGYYKPFRQFYIHFSTLNQVATDLTVEYYNGQGWVSLDSLIDETEDFSKSGFMYWERPENWAKTTVDSDEQFYIRISAADDLSAETVLKGLNVLFSNDNDLIGIRSNIVSKHNNGEAWVEKHEAARREIVQQLRNLGHRKVNVTEDNPLYTGDEKDALYYSNITQFDFIEPFELREASKFYALSYIYLDELSDEADDKYERAGIRHEKRAEQAMNVFMLRIDTDDDGVEDAEENFNSDTETGLVWV